jgi:hypothetical protein
MKTLTELTEIDADRIDIVGKGAAGTQFIILKSEGSDNLISTEEVRKLADEPLSKDEGDLLEDPDDGVPGNADLDPGSPAWESADANTAVAALSDLARLRAVVGMLADREEVEAVTSDPDDAENVWSLEDAECAIDYAMSVLAPYAIDEQAEVDLSDVTKSVMEHRGDIATVEVYQPLIKVGAKLSAASMAKLAAAKQAIDDLVASMPGPTTTEGDPKEKAPAGGANPTPNPDGGTPVAKKVTPADVAKSLNRKNGEPVTDTVASVPVAEVTKQEEIPTVGGTTYVLNTVEKASDSQILVYGPDGAEGGPIGAVDPKNMTTFANSSDPTDTTVTPDDDSTDDTTDAPEEAAPDQTTIPGTDTVQSPVEDDVTKAVAMTVADRFAEALAPFAEKFEQHAELAKSVEVLKEQLAEVMKMPDDRKSPVLNGSIGKAGTISRDGADEAPSFADIQKQIAEVTDPVQKAQLQNTLASEAIRQRISSVRDRFGR